MKRIMPIGKPTHLDAGKGRAACGAWNPILDSDPRNTNCLRCRKTSRFRVRRKGCDR